MTRWIEDLIRPYASQMYDHFARNFGEDSTAEIATAALDGGDMPAKQKKRYRRFCGFLPIPFLYSPETKSIAGPSSQSGQNYGTLATVSQVTHGQYQRLPDPTPAQHSAAAMKKTKSHDASSRSQATPTIGILKNSKSRERLAFTPPSVSNMEAAKRKKQMSSLSDGEQPRNVAALAGPRQLNNGKTASAVVKIQQPVQGHGDQAPVKVQTHAAPAQAPSANNVTKKEPSAASAAGWPTSDAQILAKPDPAKETAAAWKAAWDSVPVLATPRKNEQNGSAAPAAAGDGKTILRRDDRVTSASLSTAASIDTPSSSSKVSLNSASSTYLAAIQEARTDPLRVLERHPMFHGKKAKRLEYDEVGTTPNKAIVRVKIDGRAITQGSAAGSDHQMAKQRGAFKAIEALMVILSESKRSYTFANVLPDSA